MLKLLSKMVLFVFIVLLFSLSFTSFTLAISVSESNIDTTYMVEDMVVDSSGNIHTVVIQSVSQTANNLVYKKYN